MKKIFTLFTAAAMAITASAQEKEWNISDFDAADYVSETTIDGLTIYATETGKVSVDGNNKTVDGVKYTKRLKTGGAGSFTDGVYSRVISFDVPSNGTITLLATSSNSTDTRVVGVSFGEFIAFPAEGENPAGLNAIDVVPGNPQFFTVEYKGGSATKVYIYSKSGGVNFYDFKFTPAEGGDTPQPAEDGVVFSLYTQGTTPTLLGSVTNVVETNEETGVYTVKNFLGGDDFSFKIVMREPNNPNIYVGDLIEEGGTYEIEGGMGSYYYGLTGLKESYAVFSLDGKESVRIMNPYIGKGSMQYSYGEISMDRKTFEIRILIYGEFQTFENGEWGATKKTAYELHATVPAINGTTTGIDEVAVDFDENAPVEYYNLQGVRVAEPSNGVFIKRQGNKVVKVLVK